MEENKIENSVLEENSNVEDKAADVNGDGVVSISDVTCIQKYLVGGYTNVGAAGTYLPVNVPPTV